MTTARTLSDPRAQVTAERLFLSVLILLFVGSGRAALVYEVVWVQMRVGSAPAGDAFATGRRPRRSKE